MLERHLDITAADGVMNTFVTHPDEGGPHPVVLFLMDAPGKREELHDMARRLGSAGYYVMLPNLYYRWRREFTVGAAPDMTREAMFGLMNGLDNAKVADDARALLAFAAAEPAAARTARVGAVGYCMSGPFAFYLAGALPGQVAAAASIHGVRLIGDDPRSPHRLAGAATAELYFGCAETDEWAPPAMVEALDAHLRSVGARYRIEWYPGTHHGFVFPNREPVYVRDAAERHWERLHALFRRNLQ